MQEWIRERHNSSLGHEKLVSMFSLGHSGVFFINSYIHLSKCE